jgi:peptide/nickel transport system permease protein
VIWRHIVRNAAIPITTITGITIASPIAVAAVVEVA